jgi:hypothetical protein
MSIFARSLASNLYQKWKMFTAFIMIIGFSISVAAPSQDCGLFFCFDIRVILTSLTAALLVFHTIIFFIISWSIKTKSVEK